MQYSRHAKLACGPLVRCLFSALFCLATCCDLMAQPKNRRPLQDLSAREASDLLAQFRTHRLSGDAIISFELAILPRTMPTRRVSGRLALSWNHRGLVQRVAILSAPSDSTDSTLVREWLLQGGPVPQAWSRSGSAASFQWLNKAELLQPLVIDGYLTPFDLQMPYVYWKHFNYEGVGRLMSRHVHYYRLQPPQSKQSVSPWPSVRVAIDERYALPLAVQRYDADGALQFEQKIESIQRVSGQTIPKQYIMKSTERGDRVRFVLQSIKLDVTLDPKLFDPLEPSDWPSELVDPVDASVTP